MFEKLVVLHDDVDLEAQALHRLQAGRLHCARGCSDCCIDDLTVSEVEADHIRQMHGDLLRSERPHPPGKCAFLDLEGGCRIYQHRPYVCRTQGLPLRWIDDEDEEQIVEMRDICPLNENGPPIEDLPADECWTIGPAEDRLRMIQVERDGGELRRISLRDLFSPR